MRTGECWVSTSSSRTGSVKLALEAAGGQVSVGLALASKSVKPLQQSHKDTVPSREEDFMADHFGQNTAH